MARSAILGLTVLPNRAQIIVRHVPLRAQNARFHEIILAVPMSRCASSTPKSNSNPEAAYYHDPPRPSCQVLASQRCSDWVSTR
ncbi:hypothetical protein OH77DRAFT_1421487 [Trametes cingulata]|nr:hypothetical protein OH77DRAFT_1421487 [Trametes cingulata]